MRPDEFQWKEDQQVTVLNPTADDFSWKVHGKEYRLDSGKTAKMPGFIAWLYVYNQAVKAAEADGVWTRWNEEGFRQTYYERFVAGVDELVQIVEDKPAPEVTVFGDSTAAESSTVATNIPQAPKHGRPAKV